MENKSEVVEEVGVADEAATPPTQTVAPDGMSGVLPTGAAAITRAVSLLNSQRTTGFILVAATADGNIECTMSLAHQEAVQCVHTAVCALGHLTKGVRKEAEDTGKVEVNPGFHAAPDFNIGMSTIVSARMMFEASHIQAEQEPSEGADQPPTQH